MRKTALFAAVGLLSMGQPGWAAENAGAPGQPGTTPRMQGSPNAAGFGKAETTGTAGANTPDSTAGQDGKMKGPPNASGFRGGNAGTPSGR